MTRPKLTIDEEEERAVSPVIGVILMVAITVILAAVIGTFVLDLGQNVQNTGPSASMGFSDAEANFGGTNDFLVIEHQSGEQLDADSVRIVIRNVTDNSVVAEWDNGPRATNPATWDRNGASFQTTDTITVGDVITVSNPNGGSGVTDGEFSVTVVSTDTDNRIATGTVEVS